MDFSPLQALSTTPIRTGPEMAAFIARTLQAAEQEIPNLTAEQRIPLQDYIRQAAALPLNDADGIVRLFQATRVHLRALGAVKTHKAVKEAFQRFGMGAGLAPMRGPNKKPKSVMDQVWFWPVVIGGVGLSLGLVVLAALPTNRG